MNNRSTFLVLKKTLFTLSLTLGAFFTLPAYAWPEVDHMNMCGAPLKVSRAYAGAFRGWDAHDNYIGYKTRAGYYYRNYCQSTKAPVKGAAEKVQAVVTTKNNDLYRMAQAVLAQPVASPVKVIKRTAKYDKHADCVQVDKVNGTGPAVRFKRMLRR